MLHVCASVLLVASGANPEGPCDIYASAQTPCVAAHSMVRAMYVQCHLHFAKHRCVIRYSPHTHTHWWCCTVYYSIIPPHHC